ncbi:TIGR03067 domain-containing protein [Frigoriglobus tundricola]|uniref:TIGR03067 domain-containing protein n=1 Tax=Frigoriglobus tundricola TaxID=2774151 RepID=A0A6M5YPZ3_9BACT|nr:TIGR03067 domain-containing protein [Frigoriglobus tundricola]QJW95321.1 hypothetical protein FTUN_2868 [Frigoriglobus tundricola]
MTRSATALVLLAFSLTGLARADEKALKELEGTYKLVTVERDGKAADKALIDTVTVTIKGGEFIMTFSPEDKKVAKITATADPKLSTIDLAPQDGEAKGKTFPGIYKLEKGEVVLAFSEKGDRPKEFKSENETTFIRMKKVEKTEK